MASLAATPLRIYGSSFKGSLVSSAQVHNIPVDMIISAYTGVLVVYIDGDGMAHHQNIRHPHSSTTVAL